MTYWTNGVIVYEGDCQVGDRAATQQEVDAELARRTEMLTPKVVTNAQLKRQLNAMSKLAAAKTAVDGAGGLTLELWYGAATFHRNDPLLIQMATAIGLQANDIDAAFVAAAKL